MGKLKQLRREKGLTQETVAKSVGITTTCYRFYEQGHRIPNAAVAIEIARLLGSTVEYIWSRSSMQGEG